MRLRVLEVSRKAEGFAELVLWGLEEELGSVQDGPGGGSGEVRFGGVHCCLLGCAQPSFIWTRRS